MREERVTTQAHRWLEPVLQPGAWVLDATAGNGHDALFLAHKVSPGGRLWAVDVQEAAVQNTQARLAMMEVEMDWLVLQGDHGRLQQILVEAGLSEPASLAAAIFNLGYLPGGDPARTTQAGSTLAALDVVRELLQVGGRLAVVAYPGHPAGRVEAQAVEQWVSRVVDQGRWSQEISRPTTAPAHAPRGFFLQRCA